MSVASINSEERPDIQPPFLLPSSAKSSLFSAEALSRLKNLNSLPILDEPPLFLLLNKPLDIPLAIRTKVVHLELVNYLSSLSEIKLPLKIKKT
jgi:hypothetical protein